MQGSFFSSDPTILAEAFIKLVTTGVLDQHCQWIFFRATGIEPGKLRHDAGRFSQFRDFGTFSDSLSLDHGERGRDVLLSEYPRESRPGRAAWAALLTAVEHHNKKDLPQKAPRAHMPLLRATRDGDKLDIYRVVREYHERGALCEIAPFSAGGGVSPGLIDEFESTGYASFASCSTLSDFFFIELIWALDLNYKTSIKLLLDSGELDFVKDQLPSHAAVRDAVGEVARRVCARLEK